MICDVYTSASLDLEAPKNPDKNHILYDIPSLSGLL